MFGKSIPTRHGPTGNLPSKIPFFFFLAGGLALLLAVVMAVATLVFCLADTRAIVAQATSERAELHDSTVGDLVEHFRAAGLKGECRPKWASLIGAEEGVGYEGDGFSLEVYRFSDIKKAQSVSKTMTGAVRRGYFVMRVYDGSEKVLPVFRRF